MAKVSAIKAAKEAARSEELREESQESKLADLTSYLDTKFSIRLIRTDQPGVLFPGYCLYKHKVAVGFADIIFGSREEYVKFKAWNFRLGTFVTELFGVPTDATHKKINRMRYVIFLITRDAVFRWSYKTGRSKPYGTLLDNDNLMVCIPKREFEALE